MGNSLWLPDPDARFMKYVGRHLVALCGTYRKNGEQSKFYCYTGFVIECCNRAIVVTAGHCLEKLNTAYQCDEIVVETCRLADYFGIAPTRTSPDQFNYTEHVRIPLFDEDRGIDFGIILLNHLEAASIRENGVVPFVFDGRPQRPWGDYENYGVLGFPKESHKQHETSMGVVGAVRPTYSPIEFNEKQTAVEWRTKPRFIGRLMDANRPANAKGLSGGPIIGFLKNGGNRDYWVLAIQSTWLKASRTVYGCPLNVMFAVLNNAMKEIDN